MFTVHRPESDGVVGADLWHDEGSMRIVPLLCLLLPNTAETEGRVMLVAWLGRLCAKYAIQAMDSAGAATLLIATTSAQTLILSR